MAEFKNDDEDPVELGVRNVGMESKGRTKKKTTSFMAAANSTYKGAKKMFKKPMAGSRIREDGEDVMPTGRAEMAQITELVASLGKGDPEARCKAAAELRVLALDGDNKVAIVAAHGIGPLVDLCRDGTDEVNAGGAEAAARALWNLSINNDNKVAIAESGAIGPLVKLISNGGTIGSKEAAAGALRNLAVNVDNQVLIVEAGAVRPLVELCKEGSEEATAAAAEAAARALWNLAFNNEANQVAIACAGAVQPLVGLCKNGHSVVCKEAAAGALRNLTYNNNVNRNAMAAAGATPILVEMVKAGANEMSQMHAAALLKNLTSSPQCVSAVAKELGRRDAAAATKEDVDAEVDALLNANRSVGAGAQPNSPTSPPGGRFRMASKLVAQLTPNSRNGRITKRSMATSQASQNNP